MGGIDSSRNQLVDQGRIKSSKLFFLVDVSAFHSLFCLDDIGMAIGTGQNHAFKKLLQLFSKVLFEET